MQLLEQQRKQGLRRLQDFEKNQQLLLREEQNWCESVAAQQNTNSKYRLQQHSQHAALKNLEESKSGTSKAIFDTPKSAIESDSTKFARGVTGKGDDTVLDHVNPNSRYANDFEELEEIGRGGFGRVQKVRSNRGRTNGKQFAMKVMAKNRCKEIKSVKNELDLLKNLKSDFVINMHYAFQDEENLYLVMDLLEGGDLHF